jgi:hypothetical protein
MERRGNVAPSHEIGRCRGRSRATVSRPRVRIAVLHVDGVRRLSIEWRLNILECSSRHRRLEVCNHGAEHVLALMVEGERHLHGVETQRQHKVGILGESKHTSAPLEAVRREGAHVCEVCEQHRATVRLVEHESVREEELLAGLCLRCSRDVLLGNILADLKARASLHTL